MKRHWLFRMTSALLALLMVFTAGMPLVQAAELQRPAAVPDEPAEPLDSAASDDSGRGSSGTGSRSTRHTVARIGPDVAQPVLPARIDVTKADDSNFNPSALFDGSAGVRPKGAFRVRLRFSSEKKLSDVALFAGSSGPARGVLKLWSEKHAKSGTPPDLEIAAQAGQVGWQRVRAAVPIEGSSAMLEWAPLDAGAPGPEEISLWALEPLAPEPSTMAQDRLLTDGIAGSVEYVAKPAKAAIGRAKTAALDIDLGLDPGVFGRAFLVYELLGAPHFIHVPREINGVVAPDPPPPPGPVVSAAAGPGVPAALGSGGLQVEEIAPAWLKRGKNVVRFLASDELGTYFVRNVRVVGVPRGVALSFRFDKSMRDKAGWRSTLAFDEMTQVHEIAFKLDRPSSERLRIESTDAGGAPGKAMIDLAGLTAGWHTAPIAVPNAKHLRIDLSSSKEQVAPPISTVHVLASPWPDPNARPRRVAIAYPRHGECLGSEASLRGFVESGAAEGPKLLVDGQDASESVSSGGAFGLRLTEPSGRRGERWTANIVAIYPSGDRVSQNVELGPCLRLPIAGQGELSEDLGAPLSAVVRARVEQRIVLGTAVLEIPAGAVDADVRITARPLVKEQVAALDPTMVNVMPRGQAYRFGPHGLKFKKPIKLSLSYDPTLVPGGLSERDIFAFFFDESKGKWEQVGRLDQARDGELVSLTDHFTDFVAATLAQPETPGAQSYNPTQMKELRVADPSAGIDLIQPPSAISTGSAQLNQRLELPPGRGHVEPQLGITYDSSGGNGWLGLGWNLRLSSIQIDTRFGVPRYTGEEAYLLDGTMLVPVAGADGAPTANPRRYQRRVEGIFDRIERFGDGPTNYYWVVTAKTGNRSVYGRCPRPAADPACLDAGATTWSKLDDPRSPTGKANVAEWFLESTEDPSGNRMTVHYLHDVWNRGDKFVQLYPKRIDYTSHSTGGTQDLAPAYRVDFGLLKQADGTSFERKDVTLQGVFGFPTAVRFLLGQVDVKLMQGVPTEQVIRRYRLDYKHGDLAVAPAHFGKTLLEHVTLLGLGAQHELYRHGFEYFEAEKDDDNRPVLFADQKTWGSALRSSDGLSRTEDDTFGGSGSVGIGLGPFSLTASAGGFSGNDEVKLAAFDITGDNLLDHVDDRRRGVFGFLERNPIAVPISSGGFSTLQTLLNGPSSGQLGHTDRSGWTVEGSLNLGGVFGASIGYSRTNTEDSAVLADMDGDGFTDLVSIDDGFVRVRRGTGENRFEPTTVQWGTQIAATEFVSSRIDRSVAAAQQVHPVDPLVKWVSPFTGAVTIAGAVRKKEAGGDGVIAQIFHNDQRIWQHTFDAGDLSDCHPDSSDGCTGGLTINPIFAGDRVYLKATSPVDPAALAQGKDAHKDDLSWNAVIAFDGLSAAQQSERQPYGGLTYRYSSLDDFRLAGLPAVPYVASSKGKVVIEGAIDKKATTADEVRVNITRNGPINEVFGHAYAANDTNPVSVNGTIDVENGDQLQFNVLSDSQIDPNAVVWRPVVRYVEYCRFDRDQRQYICGPVECAPESADDPRITCRITTDPDPFIRIPVGLIAQPAQVFYPTFRWQPPVIHPAVRTDTPQHFDIDNIFTKSPSAEDVLVLIQGVNRLYYKRRFAAQDGAVLGETVGIDVPAGEQLFFSIFSNSDVGGNFNWIASVNGAPVVPTRRVLDPLQEPMSGGFHRLFYGDWNGNLTFNEASMVAAAPFQGMPFLFVSPRWQGRAGNPVPSWVGRGDDSYISAGSMKPSRLGQFGTATPGATGGLSRLRASENWNATLSVTLGASLTGSAGDTTAQLDLVDFNGDKYPDLLTSRGVLINDAPNRVFVAQDSFGDVQFPDGDFEDIRRFENRSVGVGLSAGKQLLQKTDSQGKTRGFVATAFRIGANYGLTGGAADMVDVNGDGLPDHLFKDPNSNTMKVRLNLGYSFSNAIDWNSPAWSVGQITELQDLITALPSTDAVKTGALRLDDTVSLNVGIGASVGMFGGGGGVTLTTARNNIDFVDINGDGLVDQVMRDPSEADGAGHEWIRVKLNLGDRFAAEQKWPLPGWTTTVDPGDFLPLDEQVKISGQKALSFKRSRNFSGSGEVNVCVILCVGASFYYQEGSGYSALQFQDVDGDGKPEHVLKKHDDQNLYVKINKVGKTNLLKRVERPLGGSFELDYERKGNLIQQSSTPRVDMPHAGWVLAKTTLKVSPDATPSSVGYYFIETYAYDESVFDRAERESYGFGHVTTTRGVLNTTTGLYENGDGSSTEKVYANQNYYQRGLLLETLDRGPNPKRPDLGVGALYVDQKFEIDAPPAEVLAQVRTGTFFPKELARQTTWFEGQSNALTKSTRESDKQYDAAGNLVRVLRESDGQIAGDEVRNTIQYKIDPVAYTFRPELVRTLTPDADPNAPTPDQILRERRATYDAKGRLASLTEFLRGGKDPQSPDGTAIYDGTNNPTWSFSYADPQGHDFGMISQSTDPKGFQQTYQYDAVTRTHITETSDSFGYVSKATFDLRFAKEESSEDLNGHHVRSCHDEFGRISRVYGPNDVPPQGSNPCAATAPIEPTIAHTYGTTGIDQAHAPYPAWAVTGHKDVQRPGDPINTATFIDANKRPLQTKKDLDKDKGPGSGAGAAATDIGMSVSGLVEFDERGRVRMQHQPTFSTAPASEFVAAPPLNPALTEYDVMGRVVRLRMANQAEVLTEYDIDTFDGTTYFKTRVRDQKQNVHLSYADTDQSIAAVVEHNRLGDLAGAEHCEPGAEGCAALTTRYEYNRVDELVAITDAHGHQTLASYDTMGRAFEIVSPDSDKTEYSFDLGGNVASKQTGRLRASGTRVTYEYDFNRLRKVKYPDMAAVQYSYGDAIQAGDSNGNVAGRITEEKSEAGTKTYRYDRLGNIVHETDAIVSINEPFAGPYSYVMKYSHDSFGRILTVQFPGSGAELVEYKYDHGGRIQSIFGNRTEIETKGQPPPVHTDYVKHIGYDEFEQKRRAIAGNDIETKYDYDPVMRRLNNVLAKSRDRFLAKKNEPARTFQDLRYQYDVAGNIVEIRNDAPFDDRPDSTLLVATTKYNFVYDDLYQLRRAEGVSQERKQWQNRHFLTHQYDEIGNIKKKVQQDDRFHSDGGPFIFNHTELKTSYTFDYFYETQRPHALSRTNENYPGSAPDRPRTLSYDDSGNMVEEVGHNNVVRRQTWDAENRLKTVNDNGEDNMAAVYDCDGIRSNMAAHGEEHVSPNQFLSDHWSKNGKHYVTKHIFADGVRIADKIDDATFMNKPPVFYYHPDHLGSSHYVSNGDQDLVEHHEYFASGEQWSDVVDEQYLFRRATTFNDKEFDSLTGYYYFGARYYEPRLSLWQNPDPALGEYLRGEGNRGVFEPRNLQSYTYAWSNPLMVRDLDGRQAWTPQQEKAAKQGAAIIQVVNMSKASSKEIAKVTQGLQSEMNGLQVRRSPIVTSGKVPAKYADRTFIIYVGSKEDANTDKANEIADNIKAGVPPGTEVMDSKTGKPLDFRKRVSEKLAGDAVHRPAGFNVKAARRGMITYTGNAKDEITDLINQAVHEVGHELSPMTGAEDHATGGVMGETLFANDRGHYSPKFKKVLEEALKKIQEDALKTP